MRISAALLFSVLAMNSADAAVLIQIDKTTQQMEVEVDGETRWTWPVSTGRSGYGTPTGSFRAFRLEEDHYSKEWDDAPMPHSIFFTQKGHAIHGSFDLKRIGRPASHGCVRLEPENAKKLFALVKEQGVLNTKVVLTGSEVQFAKNNPQYNSRTTKTARRTAPAPARSDDLDRRYYADRREAPRYEYRYRQPYGYQDRYAYEYRDPYYQQPQYRQRSIFPFFNGY